MTKKVNMYIGIKIITNKEYMKYYCDTYLN